MTDITPWEPPVYCRYVYLPARGESYQSDRSSALINKPKILSADEPTANPDCISSMQILELFRKLLRDTLIDDPNDCA